MIVTETKVISNETKCFKCGTTERLIQHHISYFREVRVPCCGSCHKIIHLRLRKEGKCNLTPKEISYIGSNLYGKRRSIRERELRELTKFKNDRDLLHPQRIIIKEKATFISVFNLKRKLDTLKRMNKTTRGIYDNNKMIEEGLTSL